MAQFTHHIFVCGNRRDPSHPRGCCDPQGCDALRAALKAEIARRGLEGQVRANSAGCLDQCELGPVLVIYPQGIWYGGVQPADASRIIEQTILGGQTLPDLQLADDQLNTKRAPRPTPPSAG
ncbi:MAG: (2Fe-2S) ferredoxin domain-containing protein [Pirellulales bacterium]